MILIGVHPCSLWNPCSNPNNPSGAVCPHAASLPQVTELRRFSDEGGRGYWQGAVGVSDFSAA